MSSGRNCREPQWSAAKSGVSSVRAVALLGAILNRNFFSYNYEIMSIGL